MKGEHTIPAKDENPNGLHQKYLIKKFAGFRQRRGFFGVEETPKWKNVDPEAEYFVLRLDDKAKDIQHLRACRIGIHAYADAIELYIPQLAKDLKERYPLI